MDIGRIIGSARQIKGSIKTAVGDARLKLDGEAGKAEGKVQSLVGTVKDTLKS
jgi:uncharacterized protein YjbJ (UPF0337 family)